MKLLLYCTKAMPRLVYRQWTRTLMEFDNSFEGFLCGSKNSVGINELGECEQLNGKIVAECDFEVEEIKKANYDCILFTNTLDTETLINKSCIDYFKLEEYLKPNWSKEDDLQNLDIVGYAIHIKNLHIFDEPKELNWYYNSQLNTMSKAPQNMCFAYERVDENEIDRIVLISIRPEWLCKILNGEKTIEVRKKVLKEMLE